MEKEEKINGIISKLSFAGKSPLPDDELSSDLGFDSLSMVELLIVIEESLNILIEVSDLDPARLTTVQDLYDLMQKYE